MGNFYGGERPATFQKQSAMPAVKQNSSPWDTIKKVAGAVGVIGAVGLGAAAGGYLGDKVKAGVWDAAKKAGQTGLKYATGGLAPNSWTGGEKVSGAMMDVPGKAGIKVPGNYSAWKTQQAHLSQIRDFVPKSKASTAAPAVQTIPGGWVS